MMKRLSTLLKESYEIFRLNSVSVVYNVNPSELIIQAPESYQEADIQLYMNDMWLNKLPSGQDYSEKFFGTNFENISDAYFEYDSFEHLSVEPKEYIEFDEKYAVKTNKSNEDLDYFKINNLVYKIEFDRFDLQDATEYNLNSTLKKIFKTTESNLENKYPIEIKFNEKLLEYTK